MDREEATRALTLLKSVVSQTQNDTAAQNWGVIWMVHGCTTAAALVATQLLIWRGVETMSTYVLMWLGLFAFNIASIFVLKTRRTGVRSFVETQIWAIWMSFAGGMVLVAIINHAMNMPLFYLGSMFGVMAAMGLSIQSTFMGRKYLGLAFVYGGAGVVMAFFHQYQFIILAVCWWFGQFSYGYMLHLEKKRALAETGEPPRIV